MDLGFYFFLSLFFGSGFKDYVFVYFIDYGVIGIFCFFDDDVSFF